MPSTKTKTVGTTLIIAAVIGGAIFAFQQSKAKPDLITEIQKANTGLPAAQTQGKMLIFTAMSQEKIPDAANWCDTLNQNKKLWPTGPTNTSFALNSSVAGRSYTKKEIRSGVIPGKTVVFFETDRAGWNQSGGVDLLPKESGAIAVAFADGSSSVVSPSDAARLIWTP